MKAALQKLRAGAKMDDDERTKLLNDLIKARDDLKKGKHTRSDYVLASCEAANLKQLPESDGVLNTILSKDSHKDAIKTMFYNPAANGGRGGLTTCVSPDVYRAAMDFLEKGGLEAFKDQRTNFYATLLDFNKEWNSQLEMLQPFMVGEPYEEHEPMKDKDGNVIMVRGKDGGMHALNTCAAAMHEEECHVKSSSIRGPAGGACLWMPNFSHVQREMDAWAIKKGGVALPSSEGCVRAADFPLPLREATSVDVEAQRRGLQLKDHGKRGMKNGNYVGLNDKSIDDTNVSSTKDGWFSGGFDINSSLGTRRMVPYTMKWDGKKFVEVENQYKPMNPEQWNDSAKAIQGLLKMGQRNQSLPKRVKAKIQRIAERNKDIWEQIEGKLKREHPDMSHTTLREKVESECAKHPRWVPAKEQLNYTLYQMAKFKELTIGEVRDIIRFSRIDPSGGTASDIVLCTTDGENQAAAWENMAKNMNLNPTQANELQAKLAGWREDWSDNDSKELFENAQQLGDSPSSLAQFLSLDKSLAGGAMIPLELPPKNSAASKNMFVTFNHGPLDVFANNNALSGGAKAESRVELPLNSGRSESSDENPQKEFKGYRTISPSDCKGSLIKMPSWAVILLKANAKHYAPIVHSLLVKKQDDAEKDSDYASDTSKDWYNFSEEEYTFVYLLQAMGRAAAKTEESTPHTWQDKYTNKVMFVEPERAEGAGDLSVWQKARKAAKLSRKGFYAQHLMTPDFAKQDGGPNYNKLALIRSAFGFKANFKQAQAEVQGIDHSRAYLNNDNDPSYGWEKGDQYTVTRVGTQQTWFKDGWATDLAGKNLTELKQGDSFKWVGGIFSRYWTVGYPDSEWEFVPHGAEAEGIEAEQRKKFADSQMYTFHDIADMLFVQPTVMERNVLQADGYTVTKRVYGKDGAYNGAQDGLTGKEFHFPVALAGEQTIKMLATTPCAGKNEKNLVLLSYFCGDVTVAQGREFLEWMKTKKLLGSQKAHKDRIMACTTDSGRSNANDYYNFAAADNSTATKMPTMKVDMLVRTNFGPSNKVDDHCALEVAVKHNAISKPSGYVHNNLLAESQPKNAQHVYHALYRWFADGGEKEGTGNYLQDLKKIAQRLIRTHAKTDDTMLKEAIKLIPPASTARRYQCGPLGGIYTDTAGKRGVVVDFASPKIHGETLEEEELDQKKIRVKFFGEKTSMTGWINLADANVQSKAQYDKVRTSPGLAADPSNVPVVPLPTPGPTAPKAAKPASPPKSTGPVAPPAAADAEDAAEDAARTKRKEARARRRKAQREKLKLGGGGKLSGGGCKADYKELEQELDEEMDSKDLFIAAKTKAEAAKAAADATVVEFTEATTELMEVIGENK